MRFTALASALICLGMGCAARTAPTLPGAALIGAHEGEAPAAAPTNARPLRTVARPGKGWSDSGELAQADPTAELVQRAHLNSASPTPETRSRVVPVAAPLHPDHREPAPWSDDLPEAPVPMDPEPPSLYAESGPRLTLREAQCSAARHSPLANLLDRRRRDVERQGCERKRLQQPAALASALLACQALHERNKAAGETVQLFFTLAELQEQREVLRQLRQLWASNSQIQRRLEQQGVPFGADPSSLKRQQLEIERQEFDLEHHVERAAQAMNVQIGNARLAPVPLVDVALAMDRSTVDVELAVESGISCRPDLGQLRVLRHCLNTENIETAKALVALVEPTMASLVKANCECFGCLRCLIHCQDCCDVQEMQRQIDQLYAAAKELAEVEISDKAIQVNHAVQTLSNAERMLSVWNHRVEQLERLVDTDAGQYSELAQARFAATRAVSDVIHAMAKLDQARAELLQSQGMLARQCGCGGCCDGDCVVPPIRDDRLGEGEARSASWQRAEKVVDVPATMPAGAATRLANRPSASDDLQLVLPVRFRPVSWQEGR